MRKTKTERRIEVLKDALLQVKEKKYSVTNGIYVKLSKDLKKIETSILDGDKEDVSAQGCLLNSQESCKVCAKGAIFLSIVRKENKVKLTKLDDDDTREKTSIELFGSKNLDRIEAAFEKWRYKGLYDGEYVRNRHLYIKDNNVIRDSEIVEFISKYPNKNERLIAILKNAIKNGGIFKP